MPTFKFSSTDMKIVLTNEDFTTFLALHNITDQFQFMEYLQKYSSQYTLLEEGKRCETFPFIINEKEYLLKYKQLEEQDGIFYVACIQDITYVKQLEFLKVKQEYKQMFVSVVNHQLRTPLNGIYGPLHMIKEK